MKTTDTRMEATKIQTKDLAPFSTLDPTLSLGDIVFLLSERQDTNSENQSLTGQTETNHELEPHVRVGDHMKPYVISQGRLTSTQDNTVMIGEEEAGRLINYCCFLTERFEQTGENEELDKAISLYREVLALIPTTHRHRSILLYNFTLALSTRYQQTERIDDVEEVILLHREALRQPEPHPDRSMPLKNLAGAFCWRFDQTGRIEDLDEAILLNREALELRPTPHPDRCSSLNNLRLCLSQRFEQTGRIEDLDEAISLSQEVLELEPTLRSDQLAVPIALATDLVERFQQTGQIKDLDQAIPLYRELLGMALTVDSKSSYSNGLAVSLTLRFKETRKIDDLNESIRLHQQVLELRPAPHGDRSTQLSNFAAALLTRFQQAGEIEDLKESISLHQKALEMRPVPHPGRSTSLGSLAVTISQRFELTGRSEDLYEAISLHREALGLQTTPKPFSLINLAGDLTRRFDLSWQTKDLDDSISLCGDALGLLSPVHPDRLLAHSNLATAHFKRFRQTGRLEDLDEAILFYRKVSEQYPAPQIFQPDVLDNLASALDARFHQKGRMDDLDEAILLYRKGFALRPVTDPARFGSLSNIATSLDTRFQRKGQVEDLEEAISFLQEALSLIPAEHSFRPDLSGNLAAALSVRFKQTKNVKDLNDAILLLREVLKLLPVHDPGRARPLNDLARLLLQQFGQTADIRDLHQVILLHQQALELLPELHPSRAVLFSNLASYYLIQRMSDLVPGRQEALKQDLESALVAYRNSVNCNSASPLDRFHVAQSWIGAAKQHPNPQYALEAYHATILLLPLLVTLDLDLKSRHEALTNGIDGLARNAAASAIRCGEYNRAVTFLEEGRSVFWSQSLQLRTPLAELEDKAPDFAKKFKDVSRDLEQGSQREASWDLSKPLKRLATEQGATKYGKLYRERCLLLDQIRLLDGFHSFLLPTPFNELQKAATHGPVVILNASDSGCDALVVTSSNIIHVPLPQCSLEIVAQLAKMTRIACGTSRDSIENSDLKGVCQSMCLPDMDTVQEDRHGRIWAPPSAPKPDDIFQQVLATLWTSVVQPVFRTLKLKKTETPSRLWWCSTGLFSFLPIHAAGVYNTPDAEDVFDYVVPSYTPSLKSLLRDHPSINDHSFKLTVVIQPDAPYHNSLPYTEEEFRRIKNHVPNEFLVRLGGVGNEPATVNTVVSHLSNSHVMHFACHGVQEMKDPLESSLILHDGCRLEIKEIMKQLTPNAALAFLCACKTATGTDHLPDEAMHLAASMLFAGFHGVVATMWSIADEDGPTIADSFYEYLFRKEIGPTGTVTYPNTTDGARALHHAVKKLRLNKHCPFKRWVPFIHLGF